ncbi:MAG: hypothetical protein ACPGPI_06900 [Longimicrobiales bacterium]|nr:hypothetical protein [Gemmatimonadota bacterium]
MVGKVILYGAVLVAAVATVAPDLTTYYGLILVGVGLVGGFMEPLEDVSHRVAYYVLAAVLPGLADSLDAIPVAGAYANGFLDQIAVFVAGVALANVMVQIVKQVKEA